MSGTAKKKAAQPSSTSTSKALVAVGRRDVTVSKHGSKRDKDGRRPTTSAALVLRNGKYGSFGTGEVMLASKLSGREKLDLLAGEYKNAVAYRPLDKMGPS